jgi:hypothetical protein
VVSKQDSPKVSLQRNVFSYEMVLGEGWVWQGLEGADEEDGGGLRA